MVHLNEALNEMDSKAFEYCEKLLEISIPRSIDVLKSDIFNGCHSIVHVQLMEGLKEIAYGAFQSCRSLRAVAIPSSVERTRKGAFRNCTSLVSVELPDELEEIGSQAFANCFSLTNIALAKNSHCDVDEDAFMGCTLLEEFFPLFSGSSMLMRRFQGFSVHGLCHQATKTTTQLLVNAKQTCGDTTPIRDAFGMTPFHILSSSASLRLDLFRALFDLYPSNVACLRDEQDKSPMDYLRTNSSSEVVCVMQFVLRQSMLRRLDRWGLSQWKLDLGRLVDSIGDESGMENRNLCIDEINSKMASYELLESTSLLEQRLWLNTIRPKSTNDEGADESPSVEAREACRIDSGASVVIPNIVQFMDVSL